MTRPHRYIENEFVRLSRGTLHALPLLMPVLASQIRAIFDRDAHRFNITILALNVDPYGYEIIVFDAGMRRSDFLKSVNQCISMKVKKHIDHQESVWANKKPGNAPILDLETLKNEIVRVCTAPVRKGYIRKVNEWELPNMGPMNWGETGEIENGDCEETAPSMRDLEAFNLGEKGNGTIGPGLLGRAAILSKIAVLKSDLTAIISEFEAQEMGRRKHVFGVNACRKKSTFTPNVSQKERPYEQAALVLCSNEDRKITVFAFLKTYYKAYRTALIAFIETKSSDFPTGVLKMRTVFKVQVLPVQVGDLFKFEF